MQVTIIRTSCFEDIVICGEISAEDMAELKRLKEQIPQDGEYTSYFKYYQDLYREIKKIAEKYYQPEITTI